MGKKSGPPAPDYAAAAREQGTISQDLANQTTWADRPTVNTPWGQQTWSTNKTVDPATGKPVTSWQTDIKLDPRQQSALDSQMRIGEGRSAAAEDLLGQAAENFSRPMDWDSLPSRSGSVSGISSPSAAFSFGSAPQRQQFQTNLGATPGEYRQRAQDAISQLQQPMLENRRKATESRLLNQGISEGSEAWTNAMRDISDAENRAGLEAIAAGRDEASQLFGQELQSGQFGNAGRSAQFASDLSTGQFENQRQGQSYDQGRTSALDQFNTELAAGNFNNSNRAGAIAEELQRRGMTLNELNALLTGQQVNMPNMPQAPGASTGQAPNLLGAAQAQYGSNVDQYNAKVGNINNMLSAAGQIGSFFFSDVRLKEDIREVGLLASGVRVVYYRYIGLPGRYIGVIAQEIAQVIPDAVALHPSGYLMVDYSKVF